jgi:hypothetical protein
MFINQHPPYLSLLDKFKVEFPGRKVIMIFILSIGTLQFRVPMKDNAHQPQKTSGLAME